MGAVGPAGPVDPARTARTVGSVSPVGPVGALGAVGHVGPAEPVGTVGPVGPAGPVGPVTAENPSKALNSGTAGHPNKKLTWGPGNSLLNLVDRQMSRALGPSRPPGEDLLRNPKFPYVHHVSLERRGPKFKRPGVVFGGPKLPFRPDIPGGPQAR